MGELAALACAVCFSLSSIALARGTTPTGDNGAFLSIVLTCVIGAIAWIINGSINGWTPVTIEGIAWAALAGVFASFVGRVFLFASVQHLGAVRAVAVKRLVPFFSVILAVLILGESLTGSIVAGGLLIAVSFVVLILASLRTAHPPLSNDESRAIGRKSLNAGYIYGPVSALGYAAGAIARKSGLNSMPDPYLSTFIGNLAGIGAFFVAALVSDSYRRAIRLEFRAYNRFIWAAGLLSSFGQILFFVGLNHTTVSRVTLVVSAEVFVTLFLTSFVLRSRQPASPAVVLAAILGIAGTALIFLW